MNYTIISSILIVSMIGLMTSQSVYAGAPTFDDKLARYDAALDHLINTCSKDIYPHTKQMCDNEIEEAWWIECAEHYDKLDTCKYGKVENYLKGEGNVPPIMNESSDNPLEQLMKEDLKN